MVDRDKLIRAKENWARDGRLLVPQPGEGARDRLPPGHGWCVTGRCWISARSRI
ncbi:MAG: hypothetical protein JWM77_4037 [Rhodospirillales bacterium]|nr:hypothetical protein [Rhodospirillales bacterium]